MKFKFLSANFFSCINDYTVDVATFTALTKIKSGEIFMNTRVLALANFFSCEMFFVLPLCHPVQKHAIHSAGPILEVSEKSLTHYIAPLENNDKFFVPEVTKMETEAKKDQ